LRLLPQTDNRKEIRGHCKRSGTWGVFVESVKQIKEACARIGVTLREARYIVQRGKIIDTILANSAVPTQARGTKALEAEALRLNEENWENERALDGLLKKSRG
jgi:hypothetical protein